MEATRKRGGAFSAQKNTMPQADSLQKLSLIAMWTGKQKKKATN